jgi:hypothetical protein
MLALATGFGAALTGDAGATSGLVSVAIPVASVELLCLASYVLRGWWLSGTGIGGLIALVGAPAYVAWKLLVARPFKAGSTWVRTTRVAEEKAAVVDEDAPER